MVEEIRNGSLVEALTDIWRRRRWLLIGSFIGAFAIALSIINALPPLYRASTTVLVGQEEIEESLVTSTNRNELQQRLDVIQEAMLSRSRLQQVIERYDLYPELREGEEGSMGAAIYRLRQDIFFERQLPQQQGFGQRAPAFPLTIRYQSWDPELAATVANGLADLYRQENENIRLSQAANTTAFLKEQLAQAAHDVATREKAIEDFKTAHLGELPQQENLNLSNLERLNNRLTLNEQKQVQLMAMRDNPNLAPQDLPAATLSPPQQLKQLKRQLEQMGRMYTENYPAMIRVRQQIADIEAAMPEGGWPEEERLDGEALATNSPADIDTQIERLRAEETLLKEQIEELQRKIVYSPTVEQQLMQLENDYESARSLFLSLQNRYQDARLAESLEAQQEQQFQVLEAAIPPSTPTAPKSLRLIIMSFVASMGFAAGMVFLAEQLDNTFHTPRELRNFTNLPVLGAISRIQTTGDRFRHALRRALTLLAYVVGLAVLVVLFYNLGEKAGEQIVWTLAGRGS